MPVYEYECSKCGRTYQMIRPVAERDMLQGCVLCNKVGGVRRLVSRPNIQFRGKGFVETDTRSERGVHGEGSVLHKTGRYA